MSPSRANPVDLRDGDIAPYPDNRVDARPVFPTISHFEAGSALEKPPASLILEPEIEMK